jgi:hypothetical protein
VALDYPASKVLYYKTSSQLARVKGLGRHARHKLDRSRHALADIALSQSLTWISARSSPVPAGRINAQPQPASMMADRRVE